MGVPKFFRWCAERYPNITRNLGSFAPPVDNLYLDVNGIIHNCTHPNDIDVLKKAPSEKEMIHAIFTYLERLFTVIQPRKHFMVAVDGVAPRAKMNQQRQRRYRAGYEMMVAREEAKNMGEEVPEESVVFDSNCITPGTPFMVLVSEKIQYFLAMKVSSDPSWQKCKVIYSGHDCPGEGEHKIVDFIRRRKMEPGYSPNETHCMYGLDADLIMLALTTHEPNFILLREEVKFGNNNNQNRKDSGRWGKSEVWKEDSRLMTNQTFVLLDIGVLRQYLNLDLCEICKTLGCSPNHDLERFFDDFVFSCFFIGNDFLPALPTAAINEDVILELLRSYVKQVRSKNGYLTSEGKILWNFVEVWLNDFGTSEMTIILRRQKEEEQQQKRRSHANSSREAVSTLMKTFENINEYKIHYYSEKHHFSEGYKPTGEELRKLLQDYIEGLTWVMEYYYQGPPSWKWFFPHYYAPMASDLVGLLALGKEVRFDESQPFLPHQQLLAVLPPMSYRCLPPPYWPLLRSENSPLKDAFPERLEIDREGARAPWEGIVLIPFIDEDLLLRAYESVQSQLSQNDQKSNRLGPPLEFFFDMNCLLTKKDDMFPPLVDAPVHIRPFEMPPRQVFVPQLCPGYNSRQVVEGFGSLLTPHPLKVCYGKDSVKVFDLPSRHQSLYITLGCHEPISAIEDLQGLIGREVLVGYPYWCRAKLEMLENGNVKVFRHYNTNEIVVTTMQPSYRDSFINNVKKHATLLLQRQGVLLSNTPLLAYVCLLTGMEEDMDGVLRRHYSSSAVEYPVPLITPLSELELLEDPRFKERRRLEEDSPSPFQYCVVLRDGPGKNDNASSNFFGAAGHVISSEESKRPAMSGGVETGSKRMLYNIRVKLPRHVEVSMSILESNFTCNWLTAHELAAQLGLKLSTIVTLCGSCPTPTDYGTHELGIPMKFDLQSLSRVGYAKLVHKLSNVKKVTEYTRIAKEAPPEGHYLSPKFSPSLTECRRHDGIWLLSSKAVKLICDYIYAFPPVVKFLERSDGDVRHLEPMEILIDEWADRNVEDVITEIETFVKNSGLLDAPMMSSWEDIVPLEELQKLENQLIELEQNQQEGSNKKGNPSDFTLLQPVGQRKSSGGCLIKRVPSESLFFPASRTEGGQIISFPVKLSKKRSPIYRLGSRVVNCCVTGCVPFGATGTIVRFFYARDAEVVYDVPFIGGSRLGGRLRTDRGAVQRLHFLLPLDADPRAPRVNLCKLILEEYFNRKNSKTNGSTRSTHDQGYKHLQNSTTVSHARLMPTSGAMQFSSDSLGAPPFFPSSDSSDPPLYRSSLPPQEAVDAPGALDGEWMPSGASVAYGVRGRASPLEKLMSGVNDKVSGRDGAGSPGTASKPPPNNLLLLLRNATPPPPPGDQQSSASLFPLVSNGTYTRSTPSEGSDAATASKRTEASDHFRNLITNLHSSLPKPLNNSSSLKPIGEARGSLQTFAMEPNSLSFSGVATAGLFAPSSDGDRKRGVLFDDNNGLSTSLDANPSAFISELRKSMNAYTVSILSRGEE